MLGSSPNLPESKRVIPPSGLAPPCTEQWPVVRYEAHHSRPLWPQSGAGSVGRSTVLSAGLLCMLPTLGPSHSLACLISVAAILLSLTEKIPWRREWLPTPLFLPGESHGHRNLAGYSP